MILEQGQIISFTVNACIILLGALLTFLVIWRLKIKDKNSILLFILYIIYWIGPLMTRDYTGLIQLHFGLNDKGTLLIVPLLAYGVVGLFWRPLSDLFSYKLRSRKSVLYISLGLQVVCLIPMIIRCNLATNIIQSIGAGVGASCIGMFNLMFNEHDAKRKTLQVVSILAIPPILAQFFASGFVSFVTTFESNMHTSKQFIDVIWFLWVFALFFAVASTVLTIFVKEKRETLYHTNKYKEPIKNKYDAWALVLICVAAVAMSLVKWATAGPTASIQIAYIGNKLGTDTRFYEGYSSLINTVGQFGGVILTGLLLNRAKKDWTIPLVCISCGASILYLSLSSSIINIPVYMGTQVINGFSYGIVSTIIIGIAMNKFFSSGNLITPVGIYNFALSLGICLGNLTTCLMKQELFDQIHGFSTYSFKDFAFKNGVLSLICLLIIFAMVGAYFGYYVINKKHPPKHSLDKSKFATTGETEV